MANLSLVPNPLVRLHSLQAAPACVVLGAALLLRTPARADSVWDLLRQGNPDRFAAPIAPRPLALPSLAPQEAASVWDLLRGVTGPGSALLNSVSPAEVAVQPQTPESMWDLLRRGNPDHFAATGQIADNLEPDPLLTAPASVWDILRATGPPGQTVSQDPAAPPGPAWNAGLFPRQAAAEWSPHRSGRGIFGIFDGVRRTFADVGRRLHSDIKVSGTKVMGFHMEHVSGSAETYSNDQYFGQKGFAGAYDQTDLTIQGKVAGVINFETRMSNGLATTPYDNRLSLNYASRDFKLDAGDITGSITGNSLIGFSRTLKGIQFASTITRGTRLTGLYSQTKAQTRTIVINGAESSGPYYVYAGQIVDGSEHVRVNNKDMVKGQDYTLDPYTGELRFSPGTIIHYQDVIAVSFETYGYNQSAGTIMGWRTDVDLVKGSRLGLTYLSQTGTKGPSTTATKTDQFYGYGDPGTPYQLQYLVEMVVVRDKSGAIVSATPKYPVTATVGGQPQVYGQDFVVDAALPDRVFFKYPIPSTQIVKITYVPQIQNGSPGDRSVMGLDTYFSLGKTGQVVAELASSRLDLPGTTARGGAWQVRGDTRFLKDRLHWNWSLRNISPDFTTIESPGFNRSEKGYTTGLEYAASRTLKFTATFNRSRRPSYDYSSIVSGGSTGLAQTKGEDVYSQMNLGANWQLGRGGQLGFTHNTMATNFYSGGSANYVSDNLSFAYAFQSLRMDLSIGRNISRSVALTGSSTAGGSSGSTQPALTSYDTNSLTQRLNLSWRAGPWLTLNSALGNSSSRSNGQSNNAQDLSLTAIVTPLRNMTLTLGYQLQNSGSVSSLLNGAAGGGVINPGSFYGGGVNGNLGGFGNYSGGIYNPVYGGYSVTDFSSRARTVSAQLNWQPARALSMDLTWSSGFTEGAMQFNSRRHDLGLNATYSPNSRLSVATSLSTQRMDYLGNQGGTSTNMAFFTVQSKPIGRLTMNVGLQVMTTNSSVSLAAPSTSGTPNPFGTGGTSSISTLGATNMLAYNLRLEYPVFRGNNLFLQLDNADTTGYLASTRRTLILGFDFPLTPTASFEIGWRNQQNVSKGTGISSNYSYNVNSLDADINMHF
ncbi:MAG: hypothetical protein ACP5VE_13685 [Chthonomonadales bacterium]